MNEVLWFLDECWKDLGLPEQVQFDNARELAGMVTVLSQSFRIGKRHRGLYLRLVVDTGRGYLTAYLDGAKIAGEKGTPLFRRLTDIASLRRGGLSRGKHGVADSRGCPRPCPARRRRQSRRARG